MKHTSMVLVLSFLILNTFTSIAHADMLASRKTIMDALLGAGTGAIAAEVSGGEAGEGALVGAGTSIIGNVLFDFLATPTQPSPSTSYYYQPPRVEPTYQSQPQYVVQTYAPATPQPVYTQPVVSTPTYSTQDSTKQVIQEGLLGAATGAIASEVSDGEAGTGALVGAGTQIIGSALFDLFLQPQPQAQASRSYYRPYAPVAQAQNTPSRKIVRTYDASGQLVSEEEFIL